MPFVNELCLMFMVALRHQVDRELVGLAARAADDGNEISGQQYREEVRKLRQDLEKRGAWKKLVKTRLKLETCKGHKWMEALRLLANSYKHSPSMQPDQTLLSWLKLESGVPYGTLLESQFLQKGLAAYIRLGEDATYCDIAERFVNIAADYLADVQNRNRTKLRGVKWGLVSLDPNTFAR